MNGGRPAHCTGGGMQARGIGGCTADASRLATTARPRARRPTAPAQPATMSPPWNSPAFPQRTVFISVLVILVVIHLLLGARGGSIYLERKISGNVQDRIGPNRVGFDWPLPLKPCAASSAWAGARRRHQDAPQRGIRPQRASTKPSSRSRPDRRHPCPHRLCRDPLERRDPTSPTSFTSSAFQTAGSSSPGRINVGIIYILAVALHAGCLRHRARRLGQQQQFAFLGSLRAR